MNQNLTHVDETGLPSMVDVGGSEATRREAIVAARNSGNVRTENANNGSH